MLEEAEEETVSRMVPVILERVGLLYPVQNYQQEIHQYVKAVLCYHTITILPYHRSHHRLGILCLIGHRRNLQNTLLCILKEHPEVKKHINIKTGT